MPHHRNHVLLLRHCVRSTKDKFQVCDGDAADTNIAKTKNSAKRAQLTDYIEAPLPDWDVPDRWCTERGMGIIRDLGRYLVNDAINVTSDMHVVVKIISDTHNRNADTSLALLKSMKAALKNYSFSGLDQISINHDVFGSAKSWPEKTCPLVSSKNQEVYDQISNRISLLPPSDFPVQDVLDRIADLGGLNESIHFGNNSSLYDPRCHAGTLSLPLQLLESIAETALYSRASHIEPPFLSSASDEDVYKMSYVAEYVSALKILDNKLSAKRGLVLAKSMLGGLLDEASQRMEAGDNKELVTVTLFVGHHLNINDIATTLGLRWTLPPPYVNGTSRNEGKIVSIPPGSGIMLSSSKEEEDFTMSYIVPLNLIGGKSTNTIKHQMVPIYTIDMVQPELAVRDGISRNGMISMHDLKLRVEATSRKYPDLRPCYDDAPIFLGIDGYQDLPRLAPPSPAPARTALITMALVLTAVPLLNLIGCVFFSFTGRGRPKQEYKRVPVDNQSEVELC